MQLIADGKTIGASPFTTLTMSTYLKCFGWCLYENRCLSFDYEQTADNTYLCRFYNTVYFPENGDVLIQAPGRTYYEVSLHPSHCVDWLTAGHDTDGVYTIRLPESKEIKKVYCDMTTDGGGWLVFQRRFDGSVDFDHNWEGYKVGFGTPSSEFWLGNELVHSITKSGNHELYVEGKSFAGAVESSKYTGFKLDSEANSYTILFDSYVTGRGSYSALVRNNLTPLSGVRFSTKDNDNDNYAAGSCAVLYKAAWWFDICYITSFNGPYQSTEQVASIYIGIIWSQWLGYEKSLKETKLMMRRA